MERLQNAIAKYSPYLEDIRRRLYKTAIVAAASFVAGFLSTKYILKWVLSLFDIRDVVIATTSPFQFADLSIDIGFLTALVVCSPIIVYQAFAFLRPALTRREKRLFFSLVPLMLLLFVFGFTYGVAIMYYALEIMAQINVTLGIQNIWDIGMFLSQIAITSMLLGVLFQFPVVFTFIIRMGIIGVDALRKKRRISAIIIFIFVSLLPPTDGLSLIAMALPLVILYEVTILINSGIWRANASKVLR